MDEDKITKLKWMSYAELKLILEDHGFAVNRGESEEDLREAIRINIEDGIIGPGVLN